VERTGARETNGARRRIRERGTEREGRNERGKTSGRRDRGGGGGGGEEGHRCVRGVPETAYGNGGVC